jgi:non-ribosomal peptide synthase protein (TIGR01720 family)
VTLYQVQAGQRYGSRIPIGRPIAGTSIYLLDDRLKPVPEGVAGEICVGGAGLARGYLNRDDLTAEKFVPSPFVDGERLYLTGDVGVWLPDGNLEVIGRKDNQVKIRGYRIELGEIESVLDQHPLVKESAVLAHAADGGHKRLTAWVTATSAIEIGDLKAMLRSRLPEFMMPSAFVVLDRMPITANGKIDRKALAALVGRVPAPDGPAAAPQDPTQETLVKIWQEVLGVERVGIHDNLFDLGGDSILVIQIVSRAREAGLKLSPNQLFDHQTIARLSTVAVVTPAGSGLVGEQGAIEGPARLTPMQAWFFEQAFAEPHHFNQSAFLEVPADLAPAAVEAATAAIVAHHDALRLRFARHGGHWSAEYTAPSGDAPFDTVDLSGIAADRLDAALQQAVRATQSSLDLATGPLMRVRLIRLGGGRASRLLVAVHHLVVDGVSWRILLGDLNTACSQHQRGEAVSLPAKTTSYRRWSEELVVLAGALSAADSTYWLSAEWGLAAALPLDHPALARGNTVAFARNVTCSLDPETTNALVHDVPRAYSTEINDLLLAALAITFRPWTGTDGLLIDLEGHGREELLKDGDTSRTVGWFTSQFPVLLKTGAGDPPGDVIKSVKEQLRAVPRRGAVYGVLRYLSPDAALVSRLRALPGPEILFNYVGQVERTLVPGREWTLLPDAAEWDLSARAVRPHLLEVSAIVTGGRLTVTWRFCEGIHQRHTIEELALRYESTLRGLVDHCLAIGSTQYTPSDFPAAKLDQKSLDLLVAKIGR